MTTQSNKMRKEAMSIYRTLDEKGKNLMAATVAAGADGNLPSEQATRQEVERHLVEQGYLTDDLAYTFKSAKKD